MTKRILAFGITAVFALAIAVSADAGLGDPARQKVTNNASVFATAQTSGKICKSGYDTQTSIITPPDDSTSDNAAADTVTLKKSCTGAVVGRLTSEVSTSSGGFIHLDMRATCTGTGGFSNHCTVGQQVFASPGHTFFQTNSASAIETNAATEVWPGLLPGQWKFEVLPGGNGTSFLDFRTFTADAYSGG